MPQKDPHPAESDCSNSGDDAADGVVNEWNGHLEELIRGAYGARSAEYRKIKDGEKGLHGRQLLAYRRAILDQCKVVPPS